MALSSNWSSKRLGGKVALPTVNFDALSSIRAIETRAIELREMETKCRSRCYAPDDNFVPRSRFWWTLMPLILLAAGAHAHADQNYSQQVFFENSLSPENYFYSSGQITPPSKLNLIDGKLPLETTTFVSGPNALKLEWESAADGGGTVDHKLKQCRDRTNHITGANRFI
jgi:hypothetical protein